MSSSLLQATALYALMLGVWALGAAALGASRGPIHGAGLVLLEFALVVQAVIAAFGVPGGPDPGMRAGYLAVSVLIIPLVAGAARDQDSRAKSLVVAGACLLIGVLALRMRVVWSQPGV